MKNLRKVHVIVAVMTLLLSVTAGTAHAKIRYWNSASTPLTVTGFGSTGYGYGNWTVSTSTDGTKSRLGATMKYKNADNHKVYAKLETLVNAGTCLSSDYTSCTQKYYSHDWNNSGKIDKANKWFTKRATTGVPGIADYARASINVKLDIPWRADPTSGTTHTKGVKY
ncbi:hypothetical protein SAMN06309944_1943 [Micrococcales bacterium KH10]|nr:hypothetical protein SAMN06309944_1943 [Micrococcales bacterium KH10]